MSVFSTLSKIVFLSQKCVMEKVLEDDFAEKYQSKCDSALILGKFQNSIRDK